MALVATAAAAVLFSPLWFAQRRRNRANLLPRYQDIIEALLAGELSRAREAYKEIVRSDTEDVASFLRLARIFRQSGDVERSLAVHRSLLARDLRDRRLKRAATEGMLTDLLLLRRFHEAHRVGQKLESFDRRNPHARRAAFYDALQRGDWGIALEEHAALKRASGDRADPESFQVRTHVAELWAAAGELREARRVLEEARKANPRFVPAGLLLGDLWEREGAHAEAAAVWTDLLRERPEAATHILPRLERAYFALGRFGELAPLYQSLVAQEPARVPVLRLALAQMALRKGAAAEALQALDGAAPDGRSDDLRSVCWRCYYLLEAGRADEAQTLLKQIVEDALARPDSPVCPHCGSSVAAHAARCANCLGWLPDPIMRRPAMHRKPV
jgi:lipopolysaccharide biosynthesis regulator YciM